MSRSRAACPFCGKSKTYVEQMLDEDGACVYVVCQECGCQGPWKRGPVRGDCSSKDRRDAVRAWNGRAAATKKGARKR